MGPDSHCGDGFRNFDIGQTSGERLLVDMRMVKRAGPKD
jgi:hypothetical protein